MNYIVLKAHQLPPTAAWEDPRYDNGYVLQVGEWIEDGQIEPDIVAHLIARKVVTNDIQSVIDYYQSEVAALQEQSDENKNEGDVEPLAAMVAEYQQLADDVQAIANSV